MPPGCPVRSIVHRARRLCRPPFFESASWHRPDACCSTPFSPSLSGSSPQPGTTHSSPVKQTVAKLTFSFIIGEAETRLFGIASAMSVGDGYRDQSWLAVPEQALSIYWPSAFAQRFCKLPQRRRPKFHPVGCAGVSCGRGAPCCSSFGCL